MILIRYILICIIGYLIVRYLIIYIEKGKPTVGKSGAEKKDSAPSKKVSKEIGEYIDYEDIKN